DLRILLKQATAVNPLDILDLTSLSPEEVFAYREAFDRALGFFENNNNHWLEIKKKIKNLKEELRETKKNGETAKKETNSIFAPILKRKISYKLRNGESLGAIELPDGRWIAPAIDGSISQVGNRGVFYDLVTGKQISTTGRFYEPMIYRS